MFDGTLHISIPTDDDGFVSFQCPFCSDKFKLSVGECEQEDVLQIFCPYCGLSDELSNFLSDEVNEQLRIAAQNYLAEQINSMLRDMERRFHRNPGVSFRASPLNTEPDSQIIETDDDLEPSTHEICGRTVKVHANCIEVGPYCPYCGVK